MSSQEWKPKTNGPVLLPKTLLTVVRSAVDDEDENGLKLSFSFNIMGTKRLVSVHVCLVEGYSAGIFVSKVSPGIFVIKER